ncbi:MAG: GNAT family N-acetyltransferase [Kiritimatiellia bacterium]
MSLSVNETSPEPARLKDLEALMALEESCFAPERRESRGSVRRSLLSPCQEVWVLRRGDRLTAAMTLRIFRKTLRLYSLAVSAEFRGRGLGEQLVRHAALRAGDLHISRLTLEVDAGDERLQGLYLRLGYHCHQSLPDYYGPGLAAYRYIQILSPPPTP